jgi:hypothetical protein
MLLGELGRCDTLALAKLFGSPSTPADTPPAYGPAPVDMSPELPPAAGPVWSQPGVALFDLTPELVALRRALTPGGCAGGKRSIFNDASGDRLRARWDRLTGTTPSFEWQFEDLIEAGYVYFRKSEDTAVPNSISLRMRPTSRAALIGAGSF